MREQRRVLRGRGRGRVGGQRLHDAHAGPRRQRRASPASSSRRYLERTRRGLGLARRRAAAASAASTRRRQGGEFSMPVLAIRMADHYNGVSELHGEARAMWQRALAGARRARGPDRLDHQRRAPRHRGSRGEMAALYTRVPRPRLGGARRRPRALGARSTRSPTPSSGACTSTARARLVHELPRAHARAHRARAAAASTRASSRRPTRCSIRSALTIGFARRFATYKRGDAAASAISSASQRHPRRDADRPVQLVFAGKAHPQDKGGKELIRDIVRASRTRRRFRGRSRLRRGLRHARRARARLAASTSGSTRRAARSRRAARAA